MSSSNKEETQIKKPKDRRPSLKTVDNSKFDADNLLKHKNKRNSVSNIKNLFFKCLRNSRKYY